MIATRVRLTDLKAVRARVVYHDDGLPLGHFKRWRFPDTLVIIPAHADQLFTHNERA